MKGLIMRKGLIHVYTGDGKGKTTAAFGLAMRASGHRGRILILQFLKGGRRESGEIGLAKRLGMEIIRFEDQITTLFDKKTKHTELLKSINNALSLAIDKLKSGRYDLVILDEIVTALSLGYVSKEDLQRIIDAKPDDAELVLTGRGAPRWLVGTADYVTEMRKIKHPFEHGIKGRKGVEF